MKNSKILVLWICFLCNTVLTGQSFLGVTTKSVNFRVGPSEEFEIIKTLKTGAQLFIYSLDLDNGFYFVIDIETNEEGYVHNNFVKILNEAKRNDGNIFTPVEKITGYNPTINIFNNTTKNLTLKLNNIRYTFSPNEEKKIELTPGIYNYYASAPYVIPDYGSEKLESNYLYEWEFYIVTSSHTSRKKK
jgi:hypothetical protein